MRDHGRSDAIAREALFEYCKVNQIPFGKRSPNGSSKLRLAKVSRKHRKISGRKQSQSGLESNGNDWDLSGRDEEILLWLDPVSLGSNESAGHDERVCRCIAALKAAASTKSLSNYETRQMEALLAMVARKDEETARSLMIIAWEMLRKVLAQELLRNDKSNPKPTDSQQSA